MNSAHDSMSSRKSTHHVYASIARSYVSRRLYWVFLIVGVGLWWAGIRFEDRYQSVVPSARPWKQTILAQRQATVPLAAGQLGARALEGWDWRNFHEDANSAVIYTGTSFPMERLQRMPRLRQLRLRHFHLLGPAGAVPQALQRLSELPNLEVLVLPEGVFAADHMATWGELTRLRHLEAHAATFAQGLESLPLLPSLKILSVQVRDLTPQAIDHLNHFTSLQTLIVHAGDVSELGRPRPAFYQRATEAHHQSIASLSQLKQLQTVYVPGREYSDFERIARTELPHLRVLPLRVDIHQATAILVLCGGSVMLSLLVGMQLLAQFTLPQSQLAPNFARPHLTLASLVLLTTFPVAAFFAWYRAVDIWTLLATNLCCIAAALHICRPLTSRWVGLFPLIFCLQFVLNLGPLPIFIRSTLAGEQPWIAGILFLAGLVALVRWPVNVKSYLFTAAEMGLPLPVCSLREMTLAMQTVGAREAEKGGRLARFISRDRDVLDAISQRAGRSLKMTYLPNVKGYGRSVMALVVAYAAIRGSLAWQGRGDLHTSLMHTGIIVYVNFLVGIILCTRWHSRRTFFGHELCRPITRQQFVADRFSAIAREFLLLPAWLAGVNVALLAFHETPVMVVYWGMLHALVCFSSTWLMYGCCMLTLCLIRGWTIATAYVFAALLLVVGMAIASWGSLPRLGAQPASLAAASCFFTAAGACVLQWSRHRWREAEWALTSA